MQRRGRRRNPDLFLEDLMEPVARQARRRALGRFGGVAEKVARDCEN